MLPVINLLPWRQKEKQRQKKNLAVQFGVGISVALLLAVSAAQVLDYQIDYQQTRNHILQSEIDELNRQLARLRELRMKQRSLQDRIGVVSDLQLKRNETTRALNFLATHVPEGVYFNDLSYRGGTIDINGYADSHARLAELLAELELSPEVSQVSVHTIVDSPEKGTDRKQFRVTFHLAPHTTASLQKEVSHG
ncbi:PilN domain-containing protein [Parasalinivibrio latis]|uniref:PilN domain-containing protein n=1 Tax=Parasalinivibrio latis TaxID=2952610 RepID=UPI0030DF78C4